MNTLPPEPSAHDRISASFMKALMRFIRSNTLLNGPGYKTKRGPNGTTLEIEQTHTRAAAANVLPWSFSCTEDEESGERTGGWRNCILQLGFNTILYSEDIKYITSHDSGGAIEGTDLCDDGFYFVEVSTIEKTAEIKIVGPTDPTGHDFDRGIVRIWIGMVEDGKLKYGRHQHPFVPLYAEG